MRHGFSRIYIKMKKQTLSWVVFGLILLILALPATAQSGEPARSPIAVLGRGTANALSWHPDGEVLAVGSATGVWLLDEALHITGHHTPLEYVSDLDWSPTGDRIALAGHSGETCHVQIWSADFTSSLADVDFCGIRVLWSPDGTRLAAFDGFDGQVALIDARFGEEIALLLADSATWSIDGSMFITEEWDYDNEQANLFTWDAATGAQLVHLQSDTNLPSPTLLWAIDAQTAMGLCRRIVDPTDVEVVVETCVLDLASGTWVSDLEIRRSIGGQDYWLVGLELNANQSRLVMVNKNPTRGFLSLVGSLNSENQTYTQLGKGEAFAWRPGAEIVTKIVGNGLIQNVDVTTGDVLDETMLFTAPISGIAWRPDSPQIASTGFGFDQFVRVWDADAPDDPILTFWAEPAESVVYTPDGTELISSRTIGTDIIIYSSIDAFDPDSGDRGRGIWGFYSQFDPFPLVAWNSTFTRSVRSERDNRVIFSEDISIETAYPETTLIAWSPDDTMIATASQNGDLFLTEIWDFATGNRINAIYIDMQATADQLVWSPDSTMLAIVSSRGAGGGVDRAVSVFRITPGTTNLAPSHLDLQVRDWVDDYPFSPIQLAWHSDSTILAAALRDEIAIYDVNSGEKRLAIPIRDVAGLAWASDGHALAAGSNDGLIRVWDVSDLD